ncbi:hypothetical protein ACULN0_10960 [Pectobacterium actinidiae]|uniref:hypothetical protein n=1 Tax=Pectobacterium actinidiae TaxID=1507808 RepID=UPI004040771E
MSKQTGGPAFPVERPVAHALALKNVGSEDETKYITEVNKLCGGMTLRDYFAGKALPVAWAGLEGGYFEADAETSAERMAECAYQLADAMLKAREG